jgi:hypothetical protein
MNEILIQFFSWSNTRGEGERKKKSRVNTERPPIRVADICRFPISHDDE